MMNYITRVFVLCVFVLGYAYNRCLPCYADDGETAVASVAENSSEEELIDVQFDMENDNVTLTTQEISESEEESYVPSPTKEDGISSFARVTKILFFLILFFIAIIAGCYIALIPSMYFMLKFQDHENDETIEKNASIATCLYLVTYIAWCFGVGFGLWHLFGF